MKPAKCFQIVLLFPMSFYKVYSSAIINFIASLKSVLVTSSVPFSLQRRRVPANDLQIGLQKIPGPEMLTSSEIKECNQLRNSENGFNHVFLCAPTSIVFLDYFYALKILALANKPRDSSVCMSSRWMG